MGLSNQPRFRFVGSPWRLMRRGGDLPPDQAHLEQELQLEWLQA